MPSLLIRASFATTALGLLMLGCTGGSKTTFVLAPSHDPRLLSATVATTPERIGRAGLNPPEGRAPTLTPEQAYRKALQHLPSKFTSARETYGVFIGDHLNTPDVRGIYAWVVSFAGTCIARHGPADGLCARQPFHVVIRDRDGRFFEGYSP